MYVGHVGAALAAKRAAPAAALSTLVVASYLPDWTDAALCVSGTYHDTQIYSHSIPAVAVLATVAAASQARRGRGRLVAAVVACVVISHVLLDYITGIKPTWPGGPSVGLELYAHPLIDFIIEATVITLGWLLYRATPPPLPKRWNESHLMLALLLAMQLLVDIARMLAPSLNKC